MTNTVGFRIVGALTGERRLVDWQAAFSGHATLDHRIDFSLEGYHSVFTFDQDFREQLETTGSTKDFGGPCGADFVWFDIDREDNLEAARRDAARLALLLTARYQLNDDDLLIFFSGSKGFHIG